MNVHINAKMFHGEAVPILEEREDQTRCVVFHAKCQNASELELQYWGNY